MALTNVYVSQSKREGVKGLVEDDDLVSGSSSTSAAFFELRMMTNDGSAVTNITRKDVLQALENFERFVINDTSVLGFN